MGFSKVALFVGVCLSLCCTLCASEGDVEVGNVRTQRALAMIDGQKIVLEIVYRGKLAAGKNVTILDMAAELPQEKVDWMVEAGVYEPADRYSPPGILNKLRSKLGGIIFRKYIKRFMKDIRKFDKFTKGSAKLELQQSEKELDDLIEVDGFDDRIYLPANFARYDAEQKVLGRVINDTDNDGLINFLDHQPFYYNDWSDDDQLKKQAEDELKRQAKQQKSQEQKQEQTQTEQKPEQWQDELEIPEADPVEVPKAEGVASRDFLRALQTKPVLWLPVVVLGAKLVDRGDHIINGDEGSGSGSGILSDPP